MEESKVALKIDWNRYKWAEFAAMDEDGTVWLYIHKPYQVEPKNNNGISYCGSWDSEGASEPYNLPDLENGHNQLPRSEWRNSLTERPKIED